MSASVSDPGHRPVLREMHRQRSFATGRAMTALMLREMTTTYGRSPLGYLWAILQPLGGIVLLTLVFSMMLHAPPLGKSFVLFYATGFMPFMMYQDVNGKTAMALQFSRQLLVYPSVTPVDALVARFLLNYLTQLLVAVLMFAGIMVLIDTQVVLNLPAIALSCAMVAILALGVGVMNAFLFGIMNSWQRVWAVLNRPMFLISGTIFMFDDVPEPYRSYLWYNPLVHVIGQMRRGFYPYYDGAYISVAYVFGVGLVMILLGLVFLRRYALDILNN